MIKRFFFNDNQYSMFYIPGNNHIEFTNYTTGKKFNLKVVNSSEFTWKLNKSSCSAINGARGLFCFFSNSLNNHFMESYLYKTITFFNI